MTRVLAFCDYMQEPMNGGAEIVSAEVYRRLAADPAFTIDVLSGVPGRPQQNSPAGPDVAITQLRALDLSRLIGAQLSIAPKLPWVAWRRIRRNRPDVIHASSIHFFGSMVAAVASWRHTVPMVTTCHLSGLDALPRRTRVIGRAYERTVGRFIVARSTRLIAVSTAVRDHLVASGVSPLHIDVIENGVDSRRFGPARRDPEKVVITFVGRLIDNKGPLMLLDAFGQLDLGEAELRIVGTGPLEQEIRDRASLDPRVKVLGHRSDVEAVLADSDVFVRPSTTEGRSLAILEAMAAGCAVVASDIPANAELIDDTRTGMLVPYNDVGELVAALEQLGASAALRQSLGGAARAEAEKSSWEAVSEATGAVLRETSRRHV